MKPKRKIIIGVDEAGRGPWAGPVVAASVKIKSDLEHQQYYDQIRDSKKLSEKKRQQLLDNITNDSNIEYYYSVISNEIIDDINILEATKAAMVNCLNQYNSQHDEILIDGNQTVDFSIRSATCKFLNWNPCIIKITILCVASANHTTGLEVH